MCKCLGPEIVVVKGTLLTSGKVCGIWAETSQLERIMRIATDIGRTCPSHTSSYHHTIISLGKKDIGASARVIATII